MSKHGLHVASALARTVGGKVHRCFNGEWCIEVRTKPLRPHKSHWVVRDASGAWYCNVGGDNNYKRGR